jgi:acyl carrier protein
MHKTQVSIPPCFDKIRLIIAVTTGNKIQDILPNTNLITDLGMSLSLDLPEIVHTLNQEYEDEVLNLSAGEIRQELEANESTVLELAQIVQEVRELG